MAIAVANLKAPSKRIRIFFKPQPFLWGFSFRAHLSGESGMRNRNFLSPLSRVEIFEYAMNPRLRVVRHLSSGVVERAKRERAWKSPHARKGDTRHFSLSPPRLAFLAWSDLHARSRFARSTIPEEKWGTTCSLYESGIVQTLNPVKRSSPAVLYREDSKRSREQFYRFFTCWTSVSSPATRVQLSVAMITSTWSERLFN